MKTEKQIKEVLKDCIKYINQAKTYGFIEDNLIGNINEILNDDIDLCEEQHQKIDYLENKNMAYFDFIIDIKTKLYNKEYIKAEKELANVIFNGINVQGYGQ